MTTGDPSGTAMLTSQWLEQDTEATRLRNEIAHIEREALLLEVQAGRSPSLKHLRRLHAMQSACHAATKVMERAWQRHHRPH